uniref:Uncharacterized protein n=1 Tax=Neobodo designis TaxID=312471 RepID=A0A7S1MV05_NEODS|mmetsp:Transcript_46644/g.143836  ORF Transcript_46644/g.143836 Transcript_46644/m.143836 type:complete len:503 (+) Transcript_46644:37-1545(+)
MRPSTKAALKARVREYENLQRSQHHRDADPFERIETRSQYLEDLLRLYQTEAETLAAEKERASKTSEHELSREIDRLTDTNYHLSQKLKAMHEEVATLRAERERDVSEVTAGFQRQLQRNQERLKMSSAAMQNENAVLKAKVEQLEAYVREQRALEQAEEEVRVVELQYHVDDLRNELAEKRAEVEVERRERTALEDELALLRQQQHEMITFIDALDDTAARVQDMRDRGKETHGQLVEMLLRSSQALLKEHIEASEKAELEQARIQAARGVAPMDTGDRRASTAKSDPVNDKLSEATRLLQQRQEALRSSAAAQAEEERRGAKKGQDRESQRNPASTLASAIATLRSALEAQQIEVALAARVALDAHEATLRETQGKLLNSYAQCELLVARTAELDRQAAEAREQCAAERDRALNLRDQAVLQLRTRDVRENARARRHVETQTVAARSATSQHVATASAATAQRESTGAPATAASAAAPRDHPAHHHASGAGGPRSTSDKA